MKEKNNSVVKQASTVLNNLGIWAILVLLFVFLSITTGNSFLTSSNLINLVRQICVTGVWRHRRRRSLSAAAKWT